jgi:uncharacterized membrane protein
MQQNNKDPLKDMMNTPETQFEPADVEANKVMGILAYIWLLFLVPLLAAPDSGFARFHANQGLVLFITSVILGVAGGITSTILGFMPIFGGFLAEMIGLAIWAVGIIFMVIGIVNAANGKAKELPIIGKFKLLK